MKKTIPLLFYTALFLILSLSVAADDTMYTSRRGVRVRKEPRTSAVIVTTLKSGAAVSIIESVEGDKVSGSTLWYYVSTGLFQGYIHSSLLTTVAPGSAAPPASSGTGSGSSAQQLPNLQSTPAPLVQQPVAPPPSTGASCNGATTCGQMASCEQAYACLNAGRSSLDRDKDGVPCESICPGG